MTVQEKKSIITAWGSPWEELVELKQWARDEKLKHMDDPESERPLIEREYEDALNRWLAASPSR